MPSEDIISDASPDSVEELHSKGFKVTVLHHGAENNLILSGVYLHGCKKNLGIRNLMLSPLK